MQKIENTDLEEFWRKCKCELRNILEASEARIILKVEDLNAKIKTLEKENEQLKRKIEHIEKDQRKKNLVLFGLSVETRSELSVHFMCEKLNELLELKLQEQDFSDVYFLGNSARSPVKIELVTYHKRQVILKQAKKLKGTGIFIAPDQTEAQREENRVLGSYLKKIREKTDARCFIKGSRLHVGNTSYTINELEEVEESVFEKRPNSAPPTPIPSKLEQLQADDDQTYNRKKEKDNIVNSVETPKPCSVDKLKHKPNAVLNKDERLRKRSQK